MMVKGLSRPFRALMNNPKVASKNSKARLTCVNEESDLVDDGRRSGARGSKGGEMVRWHTSIILYVWRGW